jgi:ceramide glucosyltransferase
MVLLALLASSVGLVLFAWSSQRRLLARPPLEPRGPLPSVTILRPVKSAGAMDPGFAANLKSLLALDYPDFEVVLGFQDADDPALEEARRLAALARVPVQVVVEPRPAARNPKVSNLIGMLALARHGLLLVSDSNVRVEPGYLRDLVAHLQQPGSVLVSSLIRGVGDGGLGSALEALQLNGFVMPAIAGAHRLGRPAVVGKSMLLRRRDLDAIGGLAFLGRHLAEDQVCGEELHRRGGRLAVSGQPVTNQLGRPGLAAFARRHLRWAVIRRRLAPGGYLVELLLNPFPPALALALLAPGAPTAAISLLLLVMMAGLGASSERRLGVRRPLALYPLLEGLRSLLVFGLWIVPWLGTTVVWRGTRFAVGRRTHLDPRPDRTAGPRPSLDDALAGSPRSLP